MKSGWRLVGNLALLFMFSQKIFALDDSARFFSGKSSASLVGSLALWQNPAGLAFLNGGESTFLYRRHFQEMKAGHQGGISLARSFFDNFSLSGGFGFHTNLSGASNQERRSSLSGLFGIASKLSESSTFGFSFVKTHDFLSKTSSDFLMGFGLQTRPASFIALGAHYQEVFNGYFSAAQIKGGVAIRPFKEYLTIGIDGRLSPKGEKWSHGYRLDPIFNLEASYRGLGAAIGAEIPGLSSGFRKPILTFGIKIDFAHAGLNFDGLFQPSAANSFAGAHVRLSTAEWESVKKSQGYYVRLNIASDGTLSSRPTTLVQQWFGEGQSPLAVLSLLRRIAKDSNIAGVIINLEGFSFGDASADEWREELVNLRKHNKEVVVYLDQPSAHDYYIASAAHKIFMNKQSTLSFRRFQATLTHFANLLQKIGVKAESVTAGTYKTAPRKWTHAEPTQEEVEVYNTILNTFYQTMVSKVAQTRAIDEDKVKSLFDKGIITAQEALAMGLVDNILFEDEINPTLEKEKNKNLPTYFDYQDRQLRHNSWAVPRKIAVIPVVGEIVEGRVYPSILPIFGLGSGARDVEDEIMNAANDPNVVGIVVRINSPGGDVEASHRINRALIKAREKKPVVASLSDVAASGGYLAAVGANHIIASPSTITGSIGVFSLNFSGEQLAQKIGVTATELSPLKDPGPTVFRPMSESERIQAQAMIDWHYQNFLTAVSLGLNLDKDEVLKHAEGHVWLGQEAFDKKLVHELGGFAQSIETIRAMAEIPHNDDVTIEIRAPGQSTTFTLSSGVRSLFGSKDLAREMKSLAPLTNPYFKAINAYRLRGMPRAQLPFEIDWQKP